MIQLTTHRGPVLVNPTNINHAQLATDGTKLIFRDGGHLIVNEPPAEILKLVQEWDRQNG